MALPGLTESSGASGMCAIGGLASATPYGAAISAASGLASKALEDTPTNVTSGSGSYQSGAFQVGNKQVGGKGNSAGATSATQSQTPPTGNGTVEQSASSLSTQQNQNTLYVIVGAFVVLFLGVLFVFGRRK